LTARGGDRMCFGLLSHEVSQKLMTEMEVEMQRLLPTVQDVLGKLPSPGVETGYV
jgi:hypothetical protein